MKNIRVTRARTHNLKNISVEIPKEMISVVSGISGSGKSSLAFDTVFAEGQRRYVDNLSSYARQIIGVIEKPDVDSIEGIPPAISIDQKSIARSPRSTVGTLTEAYDFLRILYARFGRTYCPNCQTEILGGEVVKLVQDAQSYIEGLGKDSTEVKIISPVVRAVKGGHKNILNRLGGSRYQQLLIDGEPHGREELAAIQLDPKRSHRIEVVVFARLLHLPLSDQDKKTLEEKLQQAFDLSADLVSVSAAGQAKLFSKEPRCEQCDIYFPRIQPRLFSFNSPYGACPICQGLGIKKELLPELVVPNERLTLAEGAIRPWSRLAGQNSWLIKSLQDIAQKKGFSLNVPFEELNDAARKVIFYGESDFEGVMPNLERKYRDTDSDYLRSEIEQYMVEKICDTCHGKRLNRFAESVKIFHKSISELSALEIGELRRLFKKNLAELPEAAKQVAKTLIKTLKNVEAVGLGYLTLARSSETLSSGEAQRIRLGVQFDSFLSGVLYVLDEPTIGLHSADTQKLINSFRRLKEEGNTVLVVEHDRSVIEAADYVFDIGPGAGSAGGELIAQGTPAELAKNPHSITGPYLSGKKKITSPKTRRKPNGGLLKVVGATHNNLKNLDVTFPLGLFICVTGVSGSGKSSLVYDILAKVIAQKLHLSQEVPGEHKMVLGMEYLDKVIRIDQTPIGRTPRSNLATYTGLFTPIRTLFAANAEAKLRGYLASRFSFNLKGGRCETCRGDGAIKVEMYFMPDVYVTCEECGGQRYNKETLEIRHRGKSVADVLAMSVDEAATFFRGEAEIINKIKILQKVGLGYLPLGQSATTLSGGEAQRIKLAAELSRPSTGKTIYILDEPTTGLHFEDINKLLSILQELVDRGNTVLVIEHNLDVVKCADWVIDLGPGGGRQGGEIIAAGTPEEVAKTGKSLTGQFLAQQLRK